MRCLAFVGMMFLAAVISWCRPPQPRAESIPFSLQRGYVIVPATLNGKPVHAFIDTGQPGITVDSLDRRRFALASAVSNHVVKTPHGGKFNLEILTVPIKVGVGDASLTVPNAAVVDLNADIPSGATREEVDLGATFFEANIVSIDYGKRILTFRPDLGEAMQCPQGALYDGHFDFFSDEIRTPIVPVIVDGHLGNVLVDTDLSGNVFVETPGVSAFHLEAEASEVATHPHGKPRSHRISLGSLTLPNTLRFEDLPFPDTVDARLGSEAFVKNGLTLTFDYTSQRLCISR